MLGVNTNITDQRRAEESVRAAALRLETLIAKLQAGVIVEDDGGQVVLTNQAFCALMGLKAQAQEMVGANVVPMARDTALLFADPTALSSAPCTCAASSGPCSPSCWSSRTGGVGARLCARRP